MVCSSAISSNALLYPSEANVRMNCHHLSLTLALDFDNQKKVLVLLIFVLFFRPGSYLGHEIRNSAKDGERKGKNPLVELCHR